MVLKTGARIFENSFKFIQIARQAADKRGVAYEFICPCCGGKATAQKSAYNGHLYATCSQCGTCMKQ